MVNVAVLGTAVVRIKSSDGGLVATVDAGGAMSGHDGGLVAKADGYDGSDVRSLALYVVLVDPGLLAP